VDEEEEIYGAELEGPVDKFEEAAIEEVQTLFNENKKRVFYGRQVEVMLENRFFHWITSRALRDLVERRIIKKEIAKLKWGGNITLYWHPTFRYYKSAAKKVVEIVEKYSLDKIGSSIGHHCELLVVEGFAKLGFLLRGRNVNEFEGRTWTESEHNLDMIFERDGIGYGIEVKNTLGYMDRDEFELKIRMCRFLGLKPVFVARMLPKSWIDFLVRHGGFALILKYQLYPEFLDDLVAQMKDELQLPAGCPKSLLEGTVRRFEKWHEKQVNLE
jgi:hypothetical protein